MIEKAYYEQELEVQESELLEMKTELSEVKTKVTEKSTQNEEVSVEVTVKEGLKELDDTIEQLNVEIP